MKSYFLIPIFLQPDCVNLGYFKLRQFIRKFELKANKKVLAKEKIRNILFSTLVWWYHTSYLYYFSRNTFKQFQNVLGNLNFFPFNIIHQTLGKFLINSKVKE